MKKSIFYTLLMLCCCWWMPQAQAQFGNFNISGQVTFAEEEIPVPEYPVHLIIPALDIQETTMTDDAGNYSLDVEIDPVFLADVEVYVIDFCIGDVITVQTTNESDSTIIDFNVCSIINPPHTGPTCDAFFQADIIDPAALTVQFIDLSFSSLPINTWAWDFGDGNSSVESSPLHTYAEIGEYEVSLTIESDSCASTVTHIVAVDTIIGGGCNCEAIFDPVCVDLFGIPIQFPNECEALCAGADPSFFVDCDSLGDCGCPPIFEPICAIDPITGEIAEFFSPCHAECEGISPDFFVDCEDGCLCTDEYDPVCVVVCEDTFEQFFNACEAECAGYGPDSFVDCDSIYIDNGICACDFTLYDPVCIETTFGQYPLINECFALCLGYDSTDIVDCNIDTTGCGCPPFNFAPVCVETSNGVVTYNSLCDAECAGYTDADIIDCQSACGCGDEFEPVCIDSGFGQFQFNNICIAECFGFDTLDVVDCDDFPPHGCDDCTDEFDPVCIQDCFGNVIVYSNLCWAECEGFTADDVVDCGDQCLCEDIYDPVCVIDPPTGIFLFFLNPCEAECAGYGPDQYTDCNTGQPDCWVDIFYYINGPNGLEVNFEAFSDNSDIISYDWNFGDGNTSTEQTPTHIYAEEGIYEVSVSVVTADSCEATISIHIGVGSGGPVDAPDCQAFFFFEHDIDAPHTFQFQDFSFGTGPLTWAWDFGDGNTSTEQNPVHTYAADGFYNVVLTIESDSCTSTFEMLLFAAKDTWYEQECQAFFLPILLEEDSMTNVVFVNLSTADAITFEWDFGNGETSTDAFPNYTYTEQGVFDVTLTITTADGCTNSFTMTLNIGESNFSGSPVFFTTTDTEEPTWVQSLTLFPNPTSDVLHLQVDSEQLTNYQLSILSTTGQQLQSQRFERNGQSTLELDVSQYPSGIYFVKVQADEEQQVLRFVKE